MQKVLIVANQFAPFGGSGVQRSIKFVKYLRQFGYEPVVLTIKKNNYGLKDITLESDIPQGVKIYRFSNFINNKITKQIANKVFIPDSEILWKISISNKILKIIDNEKIDIVYTTSAPYSSHLTGLYVKKKLKGSIKWVCDFRDEWTNNPYMLDSPHRKNRLIKEIELEKSVLLNADHIIANTPIMKKNFFKKQQLSKEVQEKFTVIPNGYDADDINEKFINNNNNKFVITYTGLLYGRRKPNCFFEAVEELIKNKEIDSKKIEIRLIGNYKKNKLRSLISYYNLNNIVKIYDYMPHKESVEMLMNSDILLLLEGDGIGSDAFYTGKIFEYMMIKKVVLGILPIGCATTLFKETNLGEVALYNDINEIKRSTLRLYELWQKNELRFNGNINKIKKYSRLELTKKLSEIFDNFKEGAL